MRRFTAIGALMVGVTQPGLAQEESQVGGLRVVLDTESRLEANDNFSLDPDGGESGVIATQSFDLALISQTRTQSLTIGVGAIYQLGEAPDTGIGTGFRDPTARLDYFRESAATALSVGLDYRQQELGLDRVLPDLADITEGEVLLPADLVEDQGTLDRIRANAELEFGRTGPLGLTVGVGYDLRDFEETSDNDLFDRRTISANAALRMDLSPVLQARLFAGYSDFSADDVEDTDRETTELGVAFDARLDARNDLTFGVSHVSTTTDETIEGTRISERESGLSGEIGLVRALPRGAASVTFASEFETTGRRNSLTFGRVFAMPRAELSVEVGATDTSDGAQLIGALRYQLEGKRSVTSAGLSRRARNTDDDEAIIQTVAELGHRYQINSASGLDFSLEYARTDGIGDATDDASRARLSAAYSRTVTRDWSLNMGVTHTREDDSGVTASSNAVFVSMGRNFTRFW